jgi:hypothetical protein
MNLDLRTFAAERRDMCFQGSSFCDSADRLKCDVHRSMNIVMYLWLNIGFVFTVACD